MQLLSLIVGLVNVIRNPGLHDFVSTSALLQTTESVVEVRTKKKNCGTAKLASHFSAALRYFIQQFRENIEKIDFSTLNLRFPQKLNFCHNNIYLILPPFHFQQKCKKLVSLLL
jgi:hypothetical protein